MVKTVSTEGKVPFIRSSHGFSCVKINVIIISSKNENARLCYMSIRSIERLKCPPYLNMISFNH